MLHIVMQFRTEEEARKAIAAKKRSMYVIPDIGSRGPTVYRIGTLDEFLDAVDGLVEFLFDDSPRYKGEDPEDLMDEYGLTEEFANAVCENIRSELDRKHRNRSLRQYRRYRP